LSAEPPNLTGNWAKFVLTDRGSWNLHGAEFFLGFSLSVFGARAEIYYQHETALWYSGGLEFI
jgi:hypothetical protein